MCCHESPWSHTEESPVAVGFAVAEELGWAALSITQPLRCLLWLGDNGPLLGRETRNLNLTQEALKATQNKLLSSGISPYRKTISAVIKGELNRLISSKVTEQPSLSTHPPPPPFPSSCSPSTLFLTIPLSRPARWRPSMKCHQISGGLEVIGQKMFCWMRLSERKGCVFCLARIDGRKVVHGKR